MTGSTALAASSPTVTPRYPFDKVAFQTLPQCLRGHCHLPALFPALTCPAVYPHRFDNITSKNID